MKLNALLTAATMALTAMVSVPAFADDKAEFAAMKAEYQKSMEAATKSGDIRGGFIKACGVKYRKAVNDKLLTQAEANKLCSCTVDAEGAVTNADNWALQSAANSKDAKRFQQLQVNLLKKQGDSIKSCVGPALGQKISKLVQQAQASAAAAPVTKK